MGVFIAGLGALATAPILMICRGSWRRFTLPEVRLLDGAHVAVSQLPKRDLGREANARTRALLVSTGRRRLLAGRPGIEATLLLDWTDGEPTVPVADAATGISFELPVAL